MHSTAASSASSSEMLKQHAGTHTVTCMLCVLSHDAAMLICVCQLVDSIAASPPSPTFVCRYMFHMSSTAFLSLEPTSADACMQVIE